ncbi:MAG: Methyltransferase type 11 [Ilumatobacteraceae bacterium]|nr:Methyltransferase type 11 [Ilumatobacteraceae bacterium]
MRDSPPSGRTAPCGKVNTPSTHPKGTTLGILRSFTSPFRNYLNNHFEMVKNEVRATSAAMPDGSHIAPQIQDEVRRLSSDLTSQLANASSTSAEAQLFVARQLSEMRQHGQVATESSSRVLEQLDRLSGVVDELLGSMTPLRDSGLQAERLLGEVRHALVAPIPKSVLDVQPRDAELLNRMNAHDGFRSQAGVWVNDPISTGFVDGAVTLNDVNERIGEVPFVFAKLGSLPVGSRVLDVGCCESIVSLSLASLGYDVTALDPRPYPFAHPRLTVVTDPVENYRDETGFDAIVLLSTIEHLGVGSYGLNEGDRLDLRAMAHLRSLLHPDGRLILTTPFGVRGVNDLERTYDVAGIQELLQGFQIVGDPVVLVRRTRTEWIPDRGGFADVDDERTRVVMLEARLAEQ